MLNAVRAQTWNRSRCRASTRSAVVPIEPDKEVQIIRDIGTIADKIRQARELFDEGDAIAAKMLAQGSYDLSKALAQFARRAKAMAWVEKLGSGSTPPDSGNLPGYGLDDGLLDTDYLPPPSAPKTGRNDPCPCGSGKKYKKCCGNPAA